MIDKYDVKMPEQRRGNEISQDQEQIQKIQALLEEVNQVDSKQELRLKERYYSHFNWFDSSNGQNHPANTHRYFSYQEESVYDFVFNLNKSGILSDQVGMGKTIEAGMIISELASRNEIKSLLIIVPNEIMAQKWDTELKEKFGICKNPLRTEEDYPVVTTVCSLEDFAQCIFVCARQRYFSAFDRSMNAYDPRNPYRHSYKAQPNQTESAADVVKRFVKQDIATAVSKINEGLKTFGVSVTFDGQRFSIEGAGLSCPYEYGKFGAFHELFNDDSPRGDDEKDGFVWNENNYFFKQYVEKLEKELHSLCMLIGQFFMTIPDVMTAVSKSMPKKFPIMVIPIAYSNYLQDQVELKQFLNHELLKEIKSYKHQYTTQTVGRNGRVEFDTVYEDYRIVDFFIDVGYQTLIVDEVHDYIDVCAKMNQEDFHDNNGFTTYPSGEYDRYELFDDYYFIRKSSLYKKLKALADKAERKIFLTATPIKSDMVDFYLLTLLASNKDSDAYAEIAKNLRNTGEGDIEEEIRRIYRSFLSRVRDLATHFCAYHHVFLAENDRDTRAEIANENRIVRYKYPYFNNQYLLRNSDYTEDKINKVLGYLRSAISYMSVEEIIMNLVLAYNAETLKHLDVRETLKGISTLFSGMGLGNAENAEDDEEELDYSEYEQEYLKTMHLQTRVVFRAILDNSIKQRFEEDFTTEDGTPIKRIRKLLETQEGPRKWHKTYRKYGIRHTRHQTYNLTNCEKLVTLNAKKQERFKNLPIWPRRNGKVIYLHRPEVFFDAFLDVSRPIGDFSLGEVKLTDLPNVEKLIGTEQEKETRFQHAVEIFNYINNSMSGGDAQTHLPHPIKYEKVEQKDDALMTEFKLVTINHLMAGTAGKENNELGSISGKVLLFAEHDRDIILEWFRYQECYPLCKSKDELDPKKLAEYQVKWNKNNFDPQGKNWRVSEDTGDLSAKDNRNLLVIIDPKRYEKGVDLQKANTIINFDINYCPLKMEQRIGRIDRIRPSGQSQEINIISFVPLNDMSGYVINFFANELKMFTQWMGETTGIVSVPEEEGRSGRAGEAIAFEDRVRNLEKHYLDLYALCRRDVSDKELDQMVDAFCDQFKTNKLVTRVDFTFLKNLRSVFDSASSNSITPHRAGFKVQNSDLKVIRFNSAAGINNECGSENCENCPKNECRDKGGNCRNDSIAFVKAVQQFCTAGLAYYQAETTKHQQTLNRIVTMQSGGQLPAEHQEMRDWLADRVQMFQRIQGLVNSLIADLNLNRRNPSCFTVPIDAFNNVFDPIKKLYWDDVVMKYLKIILLQFHAQCDSVLSSAALFEKFIKTLAIADFMSNMEGNQ